MGPPVIERAPRATYPSHRHRALEGVDITGLETAAVTIGKAVARHAAKEWLRRRRNAAERTATLAELAAAELSSPLKRGKLDNALDGIGFRAAEQLEPWLAVEFRDLPEHEVAAAIDAAVDALQGTDLSDDAIFAADADPEVLARQIRHQLPDLARRAGLSEGAVVLYGRVLDQACRYLIQVILQLAAFQPRALADVLDRLSAMADRLTDLFEHTPRTRLDAPRGTVHDEEFHAEYLRYLAGTLDRLELLGLGTRHRHRIALSVAYLSLTVTEHGTRARAHRRADNWFGQPGDRARTSTQRVEAAIGSARRTLIRGDAGSGKTTLLDWLAVIAARGEFGGELQELNGCVPFPIRLRRYAGSELPRPEQFLDHVAGWLVGIMPEGWVHRRLRGGEALVLVDGVDEVPAAKRSAVRDWLNGLVTAYPDVRVLVTARKAAAEERWLAAEGFSSVELQPMAPADVRLFLDRWHEAAADAEWLPCAQSELPQVHRRLLGQLDARPHLRELAGNPLLCAMLCALNLVRGTELPRSRMELYRAALAMLVELRDAERQIAMPLDAAAKMVLLRDLAWRLTLAGRAELPKGAALTHVERKLRAMHDVDIEPKPALDDLLVRSGVLREPVPERVDFVHRTFQEYLAASEATEEEHLATLVGHAHLDTWRETIVMACGHAKRAQARALLNDILNRADREPRHARHLRLLAASCLETVADLEPDLRERLDEVIRTRLVPPRSVRETGSLTAMGHRVLRYLPESLDGLSNAAAMATVRTAVMTHSAEALPLLARYAQHGNSAIQQELMDAWRYFDPQRYAEEVIAPMPLVDGRLRISAKRLLPFVHGLDNFTSLVIEFRAEMIDDLNELADLPRVGEVNLVSQGIVDLAPLAEHPNLTSIAIRAAARYTNAHELARLSKLTTLHLWAAVDWRSIAFVCDLSVLENLTINRLQRIADYTPFGMLSKLRALWLVDCARLISLEPIAHLHELRELAVDGCNVPNLAQILAEMFALLEEVSIDSTAVEDLRPLTALPLRYLGIVGCPVRDLAPLSTVRSLRNLWLSADQQYDGLDLLPHRVRVEFI